MSNPCIRNASTNTPSMFRQEHTALLSVFHESDFELLRSNPPSHNPDFVRSQNHSTSTSTATTTTTTTNPFDHGLDGEATAGSAHPRSAPARTVSNGNPFEDGPEHHPAAIPVARAVDEDSEQVVVPLVPAVFLGDNDVNNDEVNDDEVNDDEVNNDDEESAHSSIRDSSARNTYIAANSRPRPPEPSAIRSPGQLRRRPPLSFETGSNESASASASVSASSNTISSIRSSSTRSNSSTHTRSARLDVDVDVDADVEPIDPWSAEEWLGNGDLSRASSSSPSSTPAVEASSRSNSNGNGSSINGGNHRNRWNLRASPEEAARKLRVRLEKGSALCWQTVAQTTRKAAAAASASRSRW